MDNKYFKDGTEAIVAVQNMTAAQQTRMLMDLTWKAYVKPRGMTTKQILLQVYNTSILVKEVE